MSSSLSREKLNTDSLIACKFHLKFLQNNCQEISSPSSYFCFLLRLLCTVLSRDFDIFYFMTLVLQESDRTYLNSYVSNRRIYPTQILFSIFNKIWTIFWILKIGFLKLAKDLFFKTDQNKFLVVWKTRLTNEIFFAVLRPWKS